MRSIRAFVWLVGMALSFSMLWAAPQTKVKLLFESATAKAGEPTMAALELRMPDPWHTYWRVGGDSGAPTKIVWTLPEGWKAGEILWPVPEKLETKLDTNALFTYIYHGQTLLLIPLEIPRDAKPGNYELKAKVSWLECAESCLPGRGDVQGTFVIGDAKTPGPDAQLVADWLKRVPKPDPSQRVEVRIENSADPQSRILAVEWTNPAGSEADFYPYAADDLDISHRSTFSKSPQGSVIIRKELKMVDNKWPKSVAGILVPKGSQIAPFEVNLPLPVMAAADPVAAAASSTAGSPTTPAATAPQESQTLLGALLLAFLGGLILNIMPCVLPVIALKIFGFVNQSREDPGRVRRMGLVYGLGVVLSFLVLAALVIAVRQAGRAASWGMQFQNPIFLVVMTVVVTLVALNLFGLFEITLGGRALGAAGELASKEGYPGAFFNGVLATALGTPCTAPFLSVALGFAFSQPAISTILVFLTVGIGMAFPYVLLSFKPGWLKFLPKPGPWMGRFKLAMGFPMLATAFWLFSLTGPAYGPSGTLWFGLFLIVLALAAWMWGEFVQRGEVRRTLAMILTLSILVGAYAGILEGELHWRVKPVRAAAGAAAREPGGIEWETWSPDAVAKAREQGKTVLVDFTADWCLTCKLNKARALETEPVRKKLKELGAVALLADNTWEDPEIIREMAKFGRAAVPLVLVYPADKQAPAIVLPTIILTPAPVVEALDTASTKPTKISQK